MTERDFDKVLSRQLLSGGQWNRLVLLLSAPGLLKTYVYGNKMFEKMFEKVHLKYFVGVHAGYIQRDS